MDIQFIGEESHALVQFIAKYATKGPKSSIDEMNVINFCDASEYATLTSRSLQIMKARETGAMKARNFLLAEAPYKCDAKFQFLLNTTATAAIAWQYEYEQVRVLQRYRH